MCPKPIARRGRASCHLGPLARPNHCAFVRVLLRVAGFTEYYILRKRWLPVAWMDFTQRSEHGVGEAARRVWWQLRGSVATCSPSNNRVSWAVLLCLHPTLQWLEHESVGLSVSILFFRVTRIARAQGCLCRGSSEPESTAHPQKQKLHALDAEFGATMTQLCLRI